MKDGARLEPVHPGPGARVRGALWMALFCGAVVAGPVVAQAGPYAEAGLTVTGVRDGNLFSTALPQSDFITRYTPGVETGFRGARHSVVARYGRDLETFAEHPGLDTARARQNATLDLQSRAERGLTLGLHGAWVTTLTPGDFNITTGVASERRPARRLVLSPTAAFRFDARTTGTLTGARTLDRLSGGVQTDVRTIDLRLERRASARSAWSVGCLFSRFEFEAAGGPDLTTARSLTLGWERALGRRTALSLRGGPRVSEGSVDPEIAVALEHRMKRGSLSLAYDRSLTTVLGRSGAVVAESLSPAASLRLWRDLRVSLAPAIFRVRGLDGAEETRVRVLALELSARLTDWLSLGTAWYDSRQETPAGAPGTDIERHTLVVALSAWPGTGSVAGAPAGARVPR